jgi:hypothetical protein
LAFSFEKLGVYQKAVDFADAICVRTERFPRLRIVSPLQGFCFVMDH